MAAPTSPPSASSAAETPTMSAPACASASAAPRPIPRRQPVTSAVLPERSNDVFTAGDRSRAAVDQDLHRLPTSTQLVEDRGHPLEWLDSADQPLEAEPIIGQKRDRSLE